MLATRGPGWNWRVENVMASCRAWAAGCRRIHQRRAVDAGLLRDRTVTFAEFRQTVRLVELRQMARLAELRQTVQWAKSGKDFAVDLRAADSAVGDWAAVGLAVAVVVVD